MAPTPDHPDAGGARTVPRQVRGAGRARDARRLALAVACAVAGTALHDLVEFGRPAPENTGLVTVVLVAGAVVWARAPRHRTAVRRLSIGFTLVILVAGAVLSVLPLPIWPFEPDQGALHYLVHAAWATSLGVTVWIMHRMGGGASVASGPGGVPP